MAEAEDFFYQVGVKAGLAAIYEEGSGNPVLFQQPQQFRRGLRIRAVVEGQGHGLPAGRAATDNRQVEVGSREKGCCKAHNHKPRQHHQRQPNIHESQQKSQ